MPMVKFFMPFVFTYTLCCTKLLKNDIQIKTTLPFKLE